MVSHRAQAQFERARWRTMILLPAWTLQLLLTMSMMGLFAWRLGDTIKHHGQRGRTAKVPPAMEFAWEATNVAMSFIAAVCTLVEIGRYVAEALTPWTMLFTHIIKLTCASAILALDVVVYSQRKEYQSLVGLGLDIALSVTAITLAVHAVLTYRRLSQLDDYIRPVSNVRGYGFNDADGAHSYPSRVSLRNSIDKRLSVGSHRLSFGSTSNEPIGLQNLQRTPAYYSHERDTQFDEYVARARRNSSNPIRPHLHPGASRDFRPVGGPDES
ncbi:uncharacterized protein UV8b_05396 [Ustilaginoidea virens]|uniref:Uncharacterized protein n=1 Tax=Ustilaginoidea virens TaxID=1159556 RepID=A0A8E5MI23_USTVR|nr:uncharacterized protein UV8b_05396 [Ustilaginoidea virens]QUC21153.1 hypothetical protein UV8b_05396 [Ustilaginoidea virens]